MRAGVVLLIVTTIAVLGQTHDPPRAKCQPKFELPIKFSNKDCEEYRLDVAMKPKYNLQFTITSTQHTTMNNLTLEIWFGNCQALVVHKPANTDNFKFKISKPMEEIGMLYDDETVYFTWLNGTHVGLNSPIHHNENAYRLDCDTNAINEEASRVVQVGFKFSASSPVVEIQMGSQMYLGHIPHDATHAPGANIKSAEHASRENENSWMLILGVLGGAMLFLLIGGCSFGLFYKLRESDEPVRRSERVPHVVVGESQPGSDSRDSKSSQH